MGSAFSMPLRALATQAAVITMIGLGLAAPASAAPADGPSDKRNDEATSAKADASQSKSERAQTPSDSSTKKSDTTTESDDASGPDHSRGNAGTSGDAGSPQPLSNADQNDGGANGQCTEGPYCSTRDGEPSMNGKGDGEATGKPCAGCVGKADNKNPKGQLPDGSDRNKGYECDDNQGIGQTNPAHTGCSTTDGGGGGDVDGVETVDSPPVVKGVETLVPPAGVELYRPSTQAPAAVLPSAGVLPATGATAGMTALSVLAFGLLTLGSGVLLYRRFAA